MPRENVPQAVDEWEYTTLIGATMDATQQLLATTHAALSTPQARVPTTPYIIVSDASRAIDFYIAHFGATEVVRLADPTGKVMHAELHLGAAALHGEPVAHGSRFLQPKSGVSPRTSMSMNF
jgi:hypothetical protein